MRTSMTRILGIQKHSFWPTVCRGVGQGWRSVRTYLCTLQPGKGVFGYLLWVSSICTMQQMGAGCRGGAPCAHTSAHYNPEKVFLGTCHGCLQTAECNKWVGVSRVALQAHIPLHTTLDCIVHIEDKHGRSPKTRFLTCEVHRYVHTERHPEPPKHCVALCILKTSILGLQKHVF